jgi:hypothetical protein
LIAATVGLALTLPISPEWMISLGWIYGAAGLVGLLAQVVMGIQGRLLPLHGWYRLYAAGGLKPPARSAHTLASPALARTILVTWTCGMPVLIAGLIAELSPMISIGSGLLLAGVVLNGAQAITIASAET